MTRRGFEPLYDSVKGCCVKPLHHRARMADGVGFEPTRRVYPAYTISNRAPSAARTSIPICSPINSAKIIYHIYYLFSSTYQRLFLAEIHLPPRVSPPIVNDALGPAPLDMDGNRACCLKQSCLCPNTLTVNPVSEVKSCVQKKKTTEQIAVLVRKLVRSGLFRARRTY